MPNTIDFSRRVAQRVLEDRGLQDRVSVDDLAQAAQTHDTHNTGYLSRDELEHGASVLADQLGAADSEQRDGLDYSRQLLDAAKSRLGEAGVWVTDAQARQVLAHIDKGDGKISLDEINNAVSAIRAVARLEALETTAIPARPGIQAEAEGATADLGRRKLSDRFSYAGSGPVKVAFFDADSTLRVSKAGSVSANGPRDVALLPFVAERLREIKDEGYLIAVISNQSGVRYGHVSIEDADEALQYTADLIRAAGGEVDYIDFAETNDDNRKPETGMANRLEALLVDSFGDQATIDKSSSLMCGDSAYKRSDTRPDGNPGTNFSNSDRKFAENLGVTFEEPTTTFGWSAINAPQIDNIAMLSDLLKPFDVGRRSKGSPIFARFQDIAATPRPADPADLAAALADEIRTRAGETLPELDGGNSGLHCYTLDGDDAQRLVDVARGWRMNDTLRDQAAAVPYDPDKHVLMASLETWDEPELSVYVVDRSTLEMTQVGIEMNFVDGTDDVLERLVPESFVDAWDTYDGFNAIYHLLKQGDRLDIGGVDDGIDLDWSIDDFRAQP